jgi:hypothetical protein
MLEIILACFCKKGFGGIQHAGIGNWLLKSSLKKFMGFPFKIQNYRKN